MSMLQVKNLRKSFGDTQVLKGIDSLLRRVRFLLLSELQAVEKPRFSDA